MSKQTDPASDVWLTRAQIAKHLNVSLRQIDYLTEEGVLPFVLFGRRTKRYHRESIDRLLLERQKRANGNNQQRRVSNAIHSPGDQPSLKIITPTDVVLRQI
jgi:excisionase family DNA binding protein